MSLFLFLSHFCSLSIYMIQPHPFSCPDISNLLTKASSTPDIPPPRRHLHGWSSTPASTSSPQSFSFSPSDKLISPLLLCYLVFSYTPLPLLLPLLLLPLLLPLLLLLLMLLLSLTCLAFPLPLVLTAYITCV